MKVLSEKNFSDCINLLFSERFLLDFTKEGVIYDSEPGKQAAGRRDTQTKTGAEVEAGSVRCDSLICTQKPGHVDF